MQFGVTPQQKAPTWSLPRLRNFEAVYFIALIVNFGISIGAGFGWRHYMERCCSGTVGTRSYVFIPWVVAVTILAWTLFDVALKYRRISAAAMLVAKFTAAYDVIYANLLPTSSVAKRIVTFAFPVNHVLMWHQVHMSACMQEVAAALYSALALVLWHMATAAGESEYEALNMTEAMLTPGVPVVVTYTANSNFCVLLRSQIYNDFYIKTGGSREAQRKSRLLAAIMLRIVGLRLAAMDRNCAESVHTYPYLPPDQAAAVVKSGTMFYDARPAKDAVAGLMEAIYEAVAVNETQRLWRGITVPVMIMGVLFPIFIPPIFYSVMGADIVYVGPVLSIFVTGAVLFNICMFDPLLSPTTMHMGSVYNGIAKMAHLAETLQAQHCARTPVTLFDPADRANQEIAKELYNAEEKVNLIRGAEQVLARQMLISHGTAYRIE